MLFLTVVVVIGGGAHWYFYQRLVIDPALSGVARTAAVALLIGLAVAMIVQPMFERLARPGRLLRTVSVVAYTWMGAAFYLLLGLGLTDGMATLMGALDTEPAWSEQVWSGARAAVVLVAVAVLVGLALREVQRGPRLERVEVALRGWPDALDGYRVVQITDIHIGPILGAAFARELVERVTALSPDLIAVTGDLVDGSAARLRDEVAPFGDLSAPDGAWFVTGNHDFMSNAGRWSQRVAELGIRPLRNAHAVITPRRGSDSFVLAGVDDHQGRLFAPGEGEDVPAALAGVPPGLPIILLAHDPLTFKTAAGHDVGLQLSGHTHGGQLWPFVFLVRLVIPFVAGLYERNGSQLYVSRGTGFWGPPMRLGAPPEITEITVRPA